MSNDPSNGNDGRVVEELALTTGQLQLIERKIRRRYPVTEADRVKSIKACRKVMRDGKSQRAMLMAVRVLAALDAQSMRDEHHIEEMRHQDGIMDLRMRRAEEGLPNDSSLNINVTPVEQLPLPPALASYTKRILRPSES